MRYETGTVDINIGDQKFDTQYEKKTYEKPADVLEELQDEKSALLVLKKLNMAEDWERRTAARNLYLKDGDAAKAAAFEAQVKMYIKALEKAKKPVTEEQAREKVRAMMED